jgi:hypothetical protein
MRRAVVAATLAGLVAGCSISQAPSAPASPSRAAGLSLLASPVPSPQLDAAWTLHSDATESFAIAFPDTWNFVFRDSPTYDADLKAVNNADLIKFFGDGFRTGQGNGLKLIAAEPRSAQSGFVTNLSVFHTDLGPAESAPSLDSIASSKLNLFAKQQTITGDVKRQQLQVPAGSMEQLQYATKPNDKTVNVSTYLGTTEAGSHRFLFEIVIGTNVQDFAGLFDRIIKTFRLLPAASSPPPGTASPAPAASPGGRPASPSPHR